MMTVVNFGAFARNPGESALLVDWLQINRHWFADEFQFAAVNDFNGRVFRDLPGGRIPAVRGRSGASADLRRTRDFSLARRRRERRWASRRKLWNARGLG